MISPDDFRDECLLFLETRYEPRTVERGPFVWGEGSDRVDLFPEVDREIEQGLVDDVRRWRAELWSAGLGWIAGPPELGGRGLPARYQRAFDAVAQHFAVPGNAKLTVSLGTVAPTIDRHGDEAIRRRFLPNMHAGQLIACQLFSEPGAGSDLASVATTALREDGAWLVSGQKVWTSGAHFSDVGLALCRTSDGPRHGNLTMLMVDMRAPGVEVRPLRQMSGGSEFNEVFLTDVRVPDCNRIGAVGEGWQVAQTTLASERRAVGEGSYGGTGLFQIERYRQMVQHLGDAGDPRTRQAFADLAIHLRIAKHTRTRLAAQARSGRVGPGDGPVMKLQMAHNYERINMLAGSLAGPGLLADSGEWGTYAWAGFLTGSPSIRIAGGTDEILRNILAERVLGLPREPAPRPKGAS